MQPMIQESRPPYIDFLRKPVEDRQATIDTGSPQFRDVDFVEITPIGSKDKLVREVKAWLEQSVTQVQEGRLPQTWLDAYKGAYAQWSSGQEITREGTAIRTWPAASPSEVETCLKLHILTVEDLATANEESIMRLGMGGRGLKQRATDWLTAAKGVGKVTQEMTALRQQNEALKVRNESLEARLTKLEASAGVAK